MFQPEEILDMRDFLRSHLVQIADILRERVRSKAVANV